MPTLKEDAEFYRLAVAVGLLPCAAAITWADAQMVASGVASPELIDVSLTPESDVGRMVSALDRFPNDGDFSEDATRALHRIFVLMQTRVREGELTARKAAQTLDSLTKWARFLAESDFEHLVAAEDWFFITQQAEAEQSLISTLDRLVAASDQQSTGR
jgi:hypothetical protein